MRGTPEVTTPLFFFSHSGNTDATKFCHVYSGLLHRLIQKISNEFTEFYTTCLVCVMMNWKETPPSNYGVQSVVWFLTIENNSGAEIYCRLCATYEEGNVINLRNVMAVVVLRKENKHM